MKALDIRPTDKAKGGRDRMVSFKKGDKGPAKPNGFKTSRTIETS